MEWQSWGRDELQYWCRIRDLKSPMLSEGWLSVWINLPAFLPGGRRTGSKLKISLPVEQRGDVCIVPLSARSHKQLLFAAFLLAFVL